GSDGLDLLPKVRAAEVCPGTGEHCLPPLTSEKIHEEQDDGSGSITLPAGAHTNLYLKVPASATLALELENVGTVLELSAATDSGGARTIYRSDPKNGRQRADVALGPFAGEVIRMDFRP